MSLQHKFSVDIKDNLQEEAEFLRDCPNSKFIPTILPPHKRIIAIGDIHGDLDLAIRSFKLANLIDDNYNWIADPLNTVVVQVGDQIDSCRPIKNVYDCHNKKQPNDVPDDMKVIDFFDRINKQAEANGGAVYSLLGNHELMNSQQNFDYVSYANYYDFSYEVDDLSVPLRGPSGRKKGFEPGGPISKKLACSRNSVIVIGSNMFVHAGILPKLASELDYLNISSTNKLRYLNAVVRKWLLNKLSKDDNLTKNKNMFLEDTKISPFWTRVYGTIPTNSDLNSTQCFDYVKKIIEVFKIGQIVVGHTPQLYTNNAGINGTCYEKDGTNRLYRVDGGFAKAFKIFGKGDIIQVLEIIDDNEFRIIREMNPLTADVDIFKTESPTLNMTDEYREKTAEIFSQNRVKNNKQTIPYMFSKIW